LRKVCGECVISAEGLNQVDFSKLISLNSTAEFLLEKLWEKDFTPEMMADILCDEYDVTKEKALEDSKNLCDQLCEVGII